MAVPLPAPGDLDIAALVLLHGHDNDPAEFAVLAERMIGPDRLAVAPTGPVPTPQGAAWFESDDTGAPIPGQVAQALAGVDATLAALETEHGIGRERVVLAGYSQGAAVALLWAMQESDLDADSDAALSHPVAGVVAIAGWLPSVEGIEIDPAAGRASRVVIAHGIDDEVVPLPMGRGVARLLERNGTAVTVIEQPVGHELEPFIDDVRRWLDGQPTG